MESGKPAPTGCYKCGRPGHWSRDCPASNAGSNSESQVNQASSAQVNSRKTTVEKVKKPPATRPKLTPDILLGEEGLGYVLRYFPSNFRYSGRGHEVDDLGNLIGLYREWHSVLLPYYSFDQFVHKVEQVAGSKRAKMCINDLREKIDGGSYLNKDHGTDDNSIPTVVNDTGDNVDAEVHQDNGASSMQNTAQHDDVNESHESTIQENYHSLVVSGNPRNDHKEVSVSDDVITPEQQSRMEANRLKALERAAARSRLKDIQIKSDQV